MGCESSTPVSHDPKAQGQQQQHHQQSSSQEQQQQQQQQQQKKQKSEENSHQQPPQPQTRNPVACGGTLPDITGKTVPMDVTFVIRTETGEFEKRTTEQIFKGRNVIVFSLPGAFTPTCSTSHLPGYNDLAPVFKVHGIDEIICVSVNDTFVMNAWAKQLHTTNVTLLPDGNADFTRGMGMLVSMREVGFGDRSWRYSMLVKDGTVMKQFTEPVRPGDPFEVSDAKTMLLALFPQAKLPLFVTVFGKEGCPYCTKALSMLNAHYYTYEYIPLGEEITTRTLRAVAGPDYVTTPQIFIDGKHIGGADDLEKYFAALDGENNNNSNNNNTNDNNNNNNNESAPAMEAIPE